MDTYNHFTHRHTFAAWAAARAAQRGFTTVENLIRALETCGVVNFLQEPGAFDISEAEYDRRHGRWCHAIIESLLEAGISGATFGRAAKLIAIYIKAMVVIGPGHGSALAAIAHPPIDSILLRTLSCADDIASPHMREWRNVRWTTLDERAYHVLIAQLREILKDGEPVWHLEKYWTPTLK